MAETSIGRAFVFISFSLLSLCSVGAQNAAYKIPKVDIKLLKPKGFSASIPDSPNVSFFAFQGNINRAIARDDIGTLSGEVTQPSNGRWIFEDPNVGLKIGDVINYYVFVSANKAGYVADNLSYTVKAVEDNGSGDKSDVDCKPTATQVRGMSKVCSGQVFEDHFDGWNQNIWQVEQYIPIDNPEYPFVSYQSAPLVPTGSVEGGYLSITPRLQQNLPGFTNESIYSGTLDLFKGCTGPAESCSFQAWGATILPPVASGKVTSKGFAFKYGTIHVRAKLPQGDWLYPEILLEPAVKMYGRMNYASGVLRIAGARGNKDLSSDDGNKLLYGGLIMDLECREQLMKTKKLQDGTLWGDDFHVYSVKWTPDEITLSVDGQNLGQIQPTPSGLRGHFSNCKSTPQSVWAKGSKMAPFDEFFSVTLGVAAGGITEFQDGSISAGHRKPWANTSRKAMLRFWEDQEAWIPTWTSPNLVVDYVKIVAL